MMWPLRFLVVLVLAPLAAMATDHGTILLYHHVDTRTPASTSITPDQFEAQLDYLQEHGYVVMPLTVMLDALYAGKPVPDNAVAITFDDAYESVYSHAYPQLVSRSMPFTVFIATEPVDNGYQGFMRWQDMAAMDAGLADFGAHSVSHEHLLALGAGEQIDAWSDRVTGEVLESAARITAELGRPVRTFAYPFGEYNERLAGLLGTLDFYGLAQQSGAVGTGTNSQIVPRIPISRSHADDLQRFATAINARPLPVREVGPARVLIEEGSRVPIWFTFELGEGPFRHGQLACFSASGTPLEITPRDTEYRVALPQLTPGRNKVNCTAPSTEHSGEYFWYSRLWILADEEGAWLRR
ncbi:MAG TPA: polysaccharide deacetylase family protein [Kineobactrum sp.]